jgi:hypothetical protein
MHAMLTTSQVESASVRLQATVKLVMTEKR